ncbi:methyltransferase domain-containing protein, partial [Candidatus Micrarchaeota archaeon]|nr:methyltransferase domain-containing protein [Candidatus Micrarchaeota archaeon]
MSDGRKIIDFNKKKGERETKKKFPGKLLENDNQENRTTGPENLFKAVKEFCNDRHAERDLLSEAEEAIRRIYGRYSEEERDEFFSRLYDEFSENYDQHMGVETGHYNAMRVLAFNAGAHLKAPVLDITAGTGELMAYVIDCMEIGDLFRESEFIRKKWGVFPQLESCMECDSSLSHLFFVNEISPRMLAKAEEKLQHRSVGYLQESAYELPKELREEFSTVVCSQTFHLIPDEDKVRLAVSIREALAPGGVAVVMEEDPFRITPTPQIEPISMFLRSVVSPI